MEEESEAHRSSPPHQAMELVTGRTEIPGTCHFRGTPQNPERLWQTERKFGVSPERRSDDLRKGPEDEWRHSADERKAVTPCPAGPVPMADGLSNNFYLLARFPFAYLLGLSSLPHKFCREFPDVCKFLVLSDLLLFFLVGRGSLIKGAECPI